MYLTYLLAIVRNIDHNFSVKENPFSVKISIKKTKIKYQENTKPLDNNNIQEKYFDKSECNISERLKAYKIKNGFYFAHLFNQNILIGQIKAKAENLLKEKKSLEKSPEENKLM